MNMKLHKMLFFLLIIVAYPLNSGNIWSFELTKEGDSQYLQYNKEVMLQDFEGNKHKLNEYTGNGKWLVVMIWASDCHICNSEIKNYVDFHNKFKNKNTTVLGISVDGWEFKDNALEFIRKHKVNFPNLIAAPIVVDHLYELQTGKNLVGTPSFLIYSPSGELKAEQTGAVPTSVIEDFIGKFSE